MFNARVYLYQFLFISFLCFWTEVRADEHFTVIVAPGISEKILTVNSLRSIYSMRLKTWSDGTKIRVFVLPDDDPLHQIFSKEKLNVFPYQLRSTWDRLVFSGTGQAPIRVNSVEEMLERVSNTPGAIGYLWKADINANVNELGIK